MVERLQWRKVPQLARILDAGCGSGRVTAELLRIFPTCHVTAVDGSANMVSEARKTLAEFKDRVDIRQADLLELAYTDEFDVIFSTAVFHWIKDQDRLFANLYRALRRGGLLHAQCGGGPNLERLRSRIRGLAARPEFSPYFEGLEGLWEYPGPELMAERLRKAGFAQAETGLEETPVHLPDEQNYREFVAAVIVHPFLPRMPQERGKMFMDELVAAAAKDDPPYTLDYWRLNMSARKAD